MPMTRPKRRIDEPAMSDATILIRVEDLINNAMGPSDVNTVNYKLIQSVLHILARHLRLLETLVDFTTPESTPITPAPKKKEAKKKGGEDTSPSRDEDRKGKDGAETKSIKETKKEKKAADKKEEEALRAMSPQQREKYLKEKEKEQGVGGAGVITGVPGARPRVGSVEVVTRSEFALMEAAVNALKENAGPLPMPSLPENEKLRSDLATGTASLTDTMQAMQVSARVMAAEKGLSRMAGLLTQLAAAGALPPEFATQLQEVTTEMAALQGELQDKEKGLQQKSTVSHKSVAIDAMSVKMSRMDGLEGGLSSSEGLGRSSIGGVSTASRMSRPSMLRPRTVTQEEMDDALQTMREDLLNDISKMTDKATVSVENAVTTSNGVAEKLDVALRLNIRITDIYGLMSFYKEQLAGFDAGLTTQMKNFQEQMVQLRGDLSAGLKQFEAANSNAETAAVMELTERYDGLVLDLDETTTKHQQLTSFQKQLTDELNSLVQAVEMMREQKADRDEVVDGLRDKADNSKLAGLLQEKQFALAREDIDARLDWCYDKFKKQESAWMEALKDLTNVVKSKAEILQLLAAKEEAEKALSDIKEKLRLLAIQLGEPKAAILTRLLSKNGKCGACMESALMEALDRDFGKPQALAAYHRPTDDEPCVPKFPIPVPKDDLKVHKCKRWTGGSHTLLPTSMPREVAPASLLAHGAPVRKYTGYGDDGKLYNMEDELQPCIECNRLCKDKDNVRACLCNGTGDAVCLCQGTQTEKHKHGKK